MSTGLNYNPGPETNIANQVAQRIRAENAVKGGASWFLWVAGLSMINSLLSLSGTGFRFIFGLGLAQIVDVIAHRAGATGAVLDLVVNGCVAAVFVLFWNFARQGQKWAFYLGMGLYALDGLLTLLFQDYLGLAFHGYVLFRIYSSLNSIDALERLRAATVPANAPIVPR